MRRVSLDLGGVGVDTGQRSFQPLDRAGHPRLVTGRRSVATTQGSASARSNPASPAESSRCALTEAAA